MLITAVTACLRNGGDGRPAVEQHVFGARDAPQNDVGADRHAELRLVDRLQIRAAQADLRGKRFHGGAGGRPAEQRGAQPGKLRVIPVRRLGLGEHGLPAQFIEHAFQLGGGQPLCPAVAPCHQLLQRGRAAADGGGVDGLHRPPGGDRQLGEQGIVVLRREVNPVILIRHPVRVVAVGHARREENVFSLHGRLCPLRPGKRRRPEIDKHINGQARAFNGKRLAVRVAIAALRDVKHVVFPLFL